MLPSGNARVQAYDYTDENGKKHYKSFTAATKKQAQELVAKWKERKNKFPEVEDMTVHEAIDRYLVVKRSVLSPSTIRGYEGLQRNYFSGDLGRRRLRDLTSPIIQVWISDLSARLSPKTVRNAYALLTATLDMFCPDLQIQITLPAKKRPELYCPSDQDVKKLLEHIKGTELEIAVLLAAFGPLRRGEICALTDRDIHGNTITVSKSMVQGPDMEWVIKQPKTYGSYREIELPDFVMHRMEGIEGRIVKCTPSMITGRFIKAIKRTDCPRFRFHDLRHYSASIMHAIGVPDQYIIQRGGWQSDNVMKRVYRNSIDIETVRQTQKINEHFTNLKVV